MPQQMNSYIKNLAKRIVENSAFDKKSNTLFVTNPGISADVLKALATKHNFKVGQTKSGDFVAIPLSYHEDEFNDKYVSQFDNFLDTYTMFNKNYHTLLTAYRTFDLMEENLGEVELILSTYVEEVLSTGFTEDPITIKVSNKKAQEVVDLVLMRNKIPQKYPLIVRNLAKYGNVGFTLSYPYLNVNEEGEFEVDESKIDVTKDLVITQINPKYFKVNVDNYMNVINYQTVIDNTYSFNNNLVSVTNYTWQPWQFCHMFIPSDITEPYGQSMLWTMRSAFDQLTTLEALLAVSRASKIQRLVISIPIPNGASVVDAYQYMSEFKGNYLNSLFTDAPGTRAGRKIPGATSIFVKPAIDGFNIDKIDSNIDLSSTEDVEYFLDKILRNSKLPKGYLIGDDTITTAQSLESQDLKLGRALVPLKKAFTSGMVNLVECILAHAGFDVGALNVEVILNKPIQMANDLIGKYKDIIELTKSVAELNPQMPSVNKFQMLVEFGIPVKIARLISSNNAICVLDNVEELKGFMVGQKSKEVNGIQDVSDETMEEHTVVSCKSTSKNFLVENHQIAELLRSFTDSIKPINNKLLVETSLIKPKIIQEDK
jgi:hypothetical protein